VGELNTESWPTDPLVSASESVPCPPPPIVIGTLPPGVTGAAGIKIKPPAPPPPALPPPPPPATIKTSTLDTPAGTVNVPLDVNDSTTGALTVIE
jgi:hypothetical protein